MTSSPSAPASTPAPTSAAVTPAPAPPPPTPASRRRLALGLVAALLLLAGLAWAVLHQVLLAGHESTDNAYVQGHLVPVTAQQAGTVVVVAADEHDRVAAGQPLVTLDPADARIALDQARAALAEAVRAQRVVYADAAALAAQVAQREAEAARARTERDRAQADLDRRAPLEAGGAVTREEVAHARSRVAELQRAIEAADAALAAAREQLAAQRQQTEGVALAAHPAVQRAAARLREAWIARARCDITAPLAATVARRSVQPGQRVQAGTPLMSLVALDALWVDANFKEGQLGRLRLGQRATLTADVYGRDVVFNGTVVGFGAGTGAAFALLPAQNATGNWIKIVQRVPVRIALDAQDLQAHPLRLGLSMVVRVDVQTPVAAAPPPAPRAVDSRLAEVLQRAEAEADAEISRIVALHGGARTSAAARRR